MFKFYHRCRSYRVTNHYFGKDYDKNDIKFCSGQNRQRGGFIESQKITPLQAKLLADACKIC